MSYQPVPALGKNILTPLFDFCVEVIGLGASFKEKVIERAHIEDGERLLDVGCGTATLLITAKARFPTSQMVGIDSDDRVLEIARKNIQKHNLEVEALNARAENLPFPPASFDVVVSTLIFHHLPTGVKKRTIQEIHRVLIPGGRFLLADIERPKGILKLLFALGALM